VPECVGADGLTKHQRWRRKFAAKMGVDYGTLWWRAYYAKKYPPRECDATSCLRTFVPRCSFQRFCSNACWRREKRLTKRLERVA
jgi:hypothetical protein